MYFPATLAPMEQNYRSILKNYTNRYVQLSDVAFEDFFESLSEEHFKKKEILLSPGSFCTKQYFVLNGCFRSYFIKPNGTEQTFNFAIENWWMTESVSYATNKPSQYYLQALEDATALSIGKEKLKALFDKHQSIERLFRIIAEKTSIAAQQRVVYMMTMSREEAYEKFEILTYPFSERIPQYMIASYLGFTPEFLSMIRAKKKKAKT
ncbi:CRP-like cAMP-binding protein [Roseivirga pacifica]|uniref:cAMP-binding domain of CRP or a regulatory subunit of cAMP-dependent protein kinases n=2 Tax=Roseivirga pacifica TaxID=1267423 RepID=A0A1I0MDZ3_9BACT|nr:CRP-like cAMP-binding protein [Roseivirga pacifica]SEV86164.1 cAMP-binding domain of CRP or a regulatory subunit of cAMP-dependent protein kinases [Roseivirga pacifica]